MLGVDRDASADEIGHAYRAKALLLHPDRHAGAPADVVRQAEEAMTQLNEAKEVLEDSEARREYDATLPSVHEPTVAGGLAGEPSMPSQPAYVYVPGLRGRLNALLAGLDAIADWLGPSHAPPRHVEVPDFRDQPVSEAFHIAARAGVHTRIRRLTANPAPVDGTVVDQEPAPGTHVRRNSPVTLVVWHPEKGTTC